ncbi:MAG: hypothetical protein JNL05_12460 [Flavobacteriales bacterium]|nr:hypothetical protein [Flavobacteriales bacterium]
MIRTLLALLILSVHAPAALAQSFGNEWIDYGKQYWQFKITQEGLQRIDSVTLANAGFPVATVDPRDIQVFGREQEVPIYVEGEGDGVFNATDFVEFYAKRNDGWKDSLLWEEPAYQNAPYFSLVNDTIIYFITWDPVGQPKRIVPYTNTNYGQYVPRGWFWYESLSGTNNRYYRGNRTAIQAGDAFYSEAEGYFFNQELFNDGTNPASSQQDIVLNCPSPNLFPGTPWARLKVVVAGSNNPGAEFCDDHHLEVKFNNYPFADRVYRGYDLNTFQDSVAYFLLGPNNTVRLRVVHDLGPCGAVAGNYPDRQVHSYSLLRYARYFQMAFQPVVEMGIPDQPGDPLSLLQFQQINVQPIVYSWGDTLRRQLAQPYNNLYSALVPADPNGSITKAIMFTVGAIWNATALTPVNGTGYFTDFTQLAADSVVAIVSHTSLMNAAAQYAAYRETSPANPWNTVLADVEELYLQYGGGIRRHPLAIRGFMRHLLTAYPSKPQGLFLIGKGVQTPRTDFFSGTRFFPGESANALQCLIPSVGMPPSDNCFTLGIGGDPRILEVPVGRLAARNEQEVLDYLDKVQQFETNQLTPQPWMKNILHFRGGFNSAEWAQFDNALESFKVLAEDTNFVGRVTKFVKNGSGLIQPASADSVSDMITAGTTLMTFFAHATGGGFDITIDNPNDYDWNGRYPVMIGNSCYTGNIHLTNNASASELFVRTPDAGAIGFLSTVDIGLSSNLQFYTRSFYESFSQLNYGWPIGRHIQHAVFTTLNFQPIPLNNLNTAQSFTLHGDPMLVMNSPDQPEFTVSTPDVRLTPDPITADIDSFQVAVKVTNIGRGTLTPISVAVQRTLLEEGITEAPIVEPLTLYHEGEVLVTLPVLADSGGVGANTLSIRADLDPALVPEQIDDIGNNQVDTTFLIVSGDVVPVYPYEYAVTPETGPALKASTGDPFAAPRTYVFQIDTTDLFNSPVMEQGQVTGPGGVITWQPQSIYSVNSSADSVVFFWRCSVDSTGNGGYNWREFSFQHITNRRGWGQAHHFQFKKDRFDQIIHNRPDRRFDYFVGQRRISVNLQGGSLPADWYIDLSWQDGNACGATPAFHVAVIDPFNFTPWGTKCGSLNPNNNFGNANYDCNTLCNGLGRPINYFSFRQNNNANELLYMDTMLTQRIPDEHYVLIYTYRYIFKDPAPAQWNTIRNILGSWGATNLLNDVVPDSVPYVFLVKKGDPSTAVEQWGPTTTSYVDFNAYVGVTSRSGTITAPMAGPALEWHGAYWNDVLQPADSTMIRLSAGNAIGVESLQHERPSPEDSLTAFTTPPLGLDAALYPTARFQGAFAQTSVLDTTPSQLKRWHLLYDPAPECAIDPPLGFVEAIDSVFEGQFARVMVAVHNISEFDMDSLLMGAWVIDGTNQRRLVHYKVNRPLPAGDVLRDTIVFATDDMAGLNTLLIEANPLDTATDLYHQPEQYHFNNIAQLRFLIQDDRENPMLDVTFDGQHIIDGDVVSARPEIQVTLDDENPTLLLDTPGDTIHFKVFLTDPTNVTRRIYFREGALDVMQFVPADGPENISRIMYRPTFAADGQYTLTVQASDISRNQSGDNDYTVRFEVVNRPTITEVLNYPNPFTTSTRFVFTVTGQQPPTYMKIQIMTVSGRVVREIDMSELGPLRVGRNITEYAWDGTDQYGDKLARGVYLYRVVAKLNGEELEHRSTGADGYFEKGVGKMYLLR